MNGALGPDDVGRMTLAAICEAHTVLDAIDDDAAEREATT